MLETAVERACTVGFPAARLLPEDPLALEHASSLPIVSFVVPFWGYLLRSLI